MKREKKVIIAINMGMRANLTSITVQGSRKTIEILKKLESEGIIRGFKIVEIKSFKISIYLKYKKERKPIIKSIQRYGDSKAKIYLKGKQIKKIKKDYNTYIVTTRIGMHTLTELKEKAKELNINIGGELKYIIKINDINTRFNEK